MGLHLCYELRLPADRPEPDVADRVQRLRERAATLPFDAVTDRVRLTEREIATPVPRHGLGFLRLEDLVTHWAEWARDQLYRRHTGCADDDEQRWTVSAPSDAGTVAHGFALAPGRGSEPACVVLAQIRLADGARSAWWGECFCKTQYASAHGDDHLLRCHGSLVALLDAAVELGFDVDVHDETGYWQSRDPRQLAESVAGMNRLVARFAGALTDAVRDAGGDSRTITGAIFEHPDFERLEDGA